MESTHKSKGGKDGEATNRDVTCLWKEMRRSLWGVKGEMSGKGIGLGRCEGEFCLRFGFGGYEKGGDGYGGVWRLERRVEHEECLAWDLGLVENEFYGKALEEC